MENNLKTLRLKAGLTLQELGERAGGMSKSSIHALEEPFGSIPYLTTAYAIAEVLGVPLTKIWPSDDITIGIAKQGKG